MEQFLVTVDVVVTCGDRIALIQRRNEPYSSLWALPGGFVERGEELPIAAARELAEETGLMVYAHELMQVGTFASVGRDPRGRTLTVVYAIELGEELLLHAADDAANVSWFNLNDLPDLAFDHREIIKNALGR